MKTRSVGEQQHRVRVSPAGTPVRDFHLFAMVEFSSHSWAVRMQVDCIPTLVSVQYAGPLSGPDRSSGFAEQLAPGPSSVGGPEHAAAADSGIEPATLVDRQTVSKSVRVIRVSLLPIARLFCIGWWR